MKLWLRLQILFLCTGEIIDILDKRVAEAGNRKRQTVLLSATLHSRLSTLASLSLQDFDPIGFRVQASLLCYQFPPDILHADVNSSSVSSL